MKLKWSQKIHKNREEFAGGLKKWKGKGGKRKKEKSDKTHVKIPLYSLNGRKKITKTGNFLRKVGGGFPCLPEYKPLTNLQIWA